LQENINHFTVLIHSPPQVVLFAIDLYKDFINVERIAVASVFPLQYSGVNCAEFDTPEKLIAFVDAIPLTAVGKVDKVAIREKFNID
jgi:acyl-CoA synthetase (AMP-forming)/AMP-acid ligase II